MLDQNTTLSIQEVKTVFDKKQSNIDLTVIDLITQFNIGKLARKCAFVKKKGYNVAKFIVRSCHRISQINKFKLDSIITNLWYYRRHIN